MVFFLDTLAAERLTLKLAAMTFSVSQYTPDLSVFSLSNHVQVGKDCKISLSWGEAFYRCPWKGKSSFYMLALLTKASITFVVI